MPASPPPTKRMWPGCLIGMLLLVSAAAVWWLIVRPKLALERERTREAALVEHLHSLVDAQQQFYDEDLDEDGVYDYATASELAAQKLFDAQTNALYRIELEVEAIRWQATAEPKDGQGRYFFVDHTGVVRAQTGTFAGPQSEKLAPDTRQDPNR